MLMLKLILEDEERTMIANKSKEVVTTIVVMVGFAFLVLGSVLIDSKNIDIIYLGILLSFIIKYLYFCRK